MDQSKALAALSALANADRLALIRLLVPLGPEGMAAGQIAKNLGLSASRLSFHLTQLEQAGLIRSRRMARNVIYAAGYEALSAVTAFLLRDCCAGRLCQTSDSPAPWPEGESAEPNRVRR